MYCHPFWMWNSCVRATVTSCCFLLALASQASADGDSAVQDVFFVKPGGGQLSVQAEVKKYVCKFSYAAQGGTHEEWGITLELVDGGTAVMCSVERHGSSSYLFFENFEMEVTGPMVSITETDLQTSVRDNKPLGSDEFKKDKAKVSSVAGKFKNHLEKVAVYSPLPRDDL